MATQKASLRVVDTANRRKSKFNFTHSATTSFGFGVLKPVHCVKMIPGAKHVVNSKTLVRFDPMAAPTSQGTSTLKIWHKFVGMSDLFRNFGAYLVNQPYGAADGTTKRMDYLPRIRHRFLSALTLIGCRFTIYEYDSNNVAAPWTLYKQSGDASSVEGFLNGVLSGDTLRTVSALGSPFSDHFPDYNSASACALNVWMFMRRPSVSTPSFWLPCYNSNNLATSAFGYGVSDPVNIAKCDKVFYNSFTQGGQTRRFAFAVNFSDYGKRIMDILDGLGYGVDYQSEQLVDLSRLFACYKAYYDSFGLSQYFNYESSGCNRFLRRYEMNSTQYELNLWNGLSDSLVTLFYEFLSELSGMFVTESVDYISAHRKTDAVGVSDIGFVNNIVVAPPNAGNPNGAFSQVGNPDNEPVNVTGTTYAVYINQLTHTQVDADLLKLLYKSINRQTVAGRRIEELLRAGGYGAYVDEMKSSFIGMATVDIDISDVNATADSTNSVTGKNSQLGEVVGKGIGFRKEWKKDTFSYESDEFGYWIALAACVPSADYVQGNDQTVYDIDRYDQYNVEYDSLGYEVHNRSVVKSGQDFVDATKTSSDSDSPFGLVPRYLRYKFARSFIGGNFDRRSRRNAYLPYILCRWLHTDDFVQTGPVQSSSQYDRYVMTLTQTLADTPIAGNAWRYLNKYPWLANFERIFSAGNDYGLSMFIAGVLRSFGDWYYLNQTEEDIQFFSVFYDDCYAPMLAVEDSWSTTDDNDGKGSPMSQA